MPSRTGRPWQRRKARIIRRDQGICWICGGPGADSADHIVPWAKGGTDHDANLRAVHHNVEPKCNRRKGTDDVETARERIGLNRTTGGDGDWDW